MLMDTMKRFSSQAIGSALMGISVKNFQSSKSELLKHMTRSLELNVLQGFTLLCMVAAPGLLKLLRLKYMDKETENFTRNLVWDTVKYR